MTAKELFAVIVRGIGLVLLVIGNVGLAFRVIGHYFLPSYELSVGEISDAVGWAFVAGLGLAILFATQLIVRLVYGSQP
jgi:hypothetical protein